MKGLSRSRTSSQHKEDCFAPEGQRAGNKRQIQEMEDEGEGQGYLSPSGTKECLWIERRQPRTIGKWRFIKVKGKPCVRMKCLILNRLVN